MQTLRHGGVHRREHGRIRHIHGERGCDGPRDRRHERRRRHVKLRGGARLAAHVNRRRGDGVVGRASSGDGEDHHRGRDLETCL